MTSNLSKVRLVAAGAALAAWAGGAWALPQSIDLSTSTSWTIRYNDVEAQVGRVGPAFAYDCLGNAAGPQCLSVTSTGYAGGAWLPGATEAGFMGNWQTYVDFTLPTGAINVQLVYAVLGVDDAASLVIHSNGIGIFIDQAVIGTALPAGTLSLDGAFSNAGPTYRLMLEVENNASFLDGGAPAPIGFDDGTAVVGRFRVIFDLPGNPDPDPNNVPVPGTLACAGLALATALGARRRPRGGCVSPPCASPR